MIDQNWVFLAVALNLIGAGIYSYTVIRGNTRPNLVTWFILSIAPMLAFAAMMFEGVSFRESVFTLVVGVSPLIIFISSFFAKHPRWKITKFDLTCGALSVSGFILWILLQEANIAIVFAILADGLAFLPTLVKAFRYPESESPYLFMLGVVASIIALLILTTYDFKHLAFPLYILTADTLAVLFIYFKFGKLIMRNVKLPESEVIR